MVPEIMAAVQTSGGNFLGLSLMRRACPQLMGSKCVIDAAQHGRLFRNSSLLISFGDCHLWLKQLVPGWQLGSDSMP